jgi:hypothetical protein
LNNFFITNFEDKQQYSKYSFTQHLNYKIYYNNNCKLYREDNLVALFVGIEFTNKNIIENYKLHGENIFKVIEGEYSLVIFDKDKILLGVDTFGTMPLFFYKNNNDISICDSYSTLTKSNRVYENTYIIFDLNNIYLHEQYTFNTQQMKDNIKDWENALYESIKKRIRTKPTLMLSEGIDSGVIACALDNLQIKFNCLSLLPQNSSYSKIFYDRQAIHNSTIIREDELKDRVEIHFDSLVTRFNQRLDCFEDVTCGTTDVAIRLIDYVSKISEQLIIHGCGCAFADVGCNDLYNKVNNIRGLNYDNPIMARNLCSLYNKDTTFILKDRNLIQEMLWLRKDIFTEYKHPATQFLDNHNYPYFITSTNFTVEYKDIPRIGLN